MKKKCPWCNQKLDDSFIELCVFIPNRFGFKKQPKTFQVHQDCKENFEDYISFVSKYSKLFVSYMLMSVFLFLSFIILAFINEEIAVFGSGLLVILTGIVIFIFPFATPETVSILGIKKSKRLVRVFSPIMIILGVWVLVFNI